MNSLIECPICQKVLEQPVCLPCGHTVCKKHELMTSECESRKLTCAKCHISHSIPENIGFPVINLIEDLIKHKFDSRYVAPEHNAAICTLKDLREKVEDVKSKLKLTEDEIDTYITELINKIDIKREETKKKIDDEALELIQDLKAHKELWRANLTAEDNGLLRETKESIKNVENDIAKWQSELNLFEKISKKWKSIKEDANAAYNEFSEVEERFCDFFFLKNKLDSLELREARFCKLKDELIL